MRGPWHLLLAILLAGCLSPAPADVLTEAAPAPTPPPPEPPMRVTWSPAHPKPGDVLRIEIDAPQRWPEPRCLTSDIPARGVYLLPPTNGGSSASRPASASGDRYECFHVVAQGAGAVSFSVTRPHLDGERVRIHGPHVVPVDARLAQQRVSFASFELTDDDGLPRARADAHPLLAQLTVPGAWPAPAWNTTYSWISLEVVPAGNTLHMSDYAYPRWSTPIHIDTTIDVPERIRAAGAHFGQRYDTGSYVLASVAHAMNDVAFAVSEGQVRGYGRCADGSCFVRDG